MFTAAFLVNWEIKKDLYRTRRYRSEMAKFHYFSTNLVSTLLTYYY